MIGRLDPVAQRAAPWGGPEAPIFQISPLMGIYGLEGKGPPTASGCRRPFALVAWCQGAFENE